MDGGRFDPDPTRTQDLSQATKTNFSHARMQSFEDTVHGISQVMCQVDFTR
jgi:hypothetical protein